MSQNSPHTHVATANALATAGAVCVTQSLDHKPYPRIALLPAATSGSEVICPDASG